MDLPRSPRAREGQPAVSDPPIVLQFYLPYPKDRLADLPRCPDDYWAWIVRHRSVGEGKYSWTLQTYLYLRAAGISCALATEFPRRGIVITHRDFLPVFQFPRSDVFLVCIKPDRKEHTWAQHYVVQNRSDKTFAQFGAYRVSDTPSWPQPSLVARDEGRGDLCVNIAYFGRMMNLAPELQVEQWGRELRGLGLRWMRMPLEKWNDYSQVDVTVSIRGFGESAATDDPVLDPDSKPPAKLTNSWLAGVPAVVGAESSYRNIRQSDLDFLEVGTRSELIAALVRLRDDKALYEKMRAHAAVRAHEFSVAGVRRRWEAILETEILARYEAWQKMGRVKRQATNLLRLFRYFAQKRNMKDAMTVLTRGLRRIIGLGVR